MTVQKFLHTIDAISTWAGKTAAWLIIALMTVVCLEVFKRYFLNAPTAWIFDAENMLYGTFFMLAGAYTLAQNAHVRGDFLYSSMRPRLQASLDLVLYLVFFIKTGEWPTRLHDVTEIDVVEEQLAHSEYVDEETRKIAIERAHQIDEAARQRGMGGDLNK
jgi:TRAP-type mannitol/chloroaromatic compound transport system permease small subunit